MKKIASFLLFFTLSTFLVRAQSALEGAWMHQSGDVITVLLFQDGYYVSASYTSTAFKETNGGPYTVDGSKIAVKQEFNSARKELADENIAFSIKNDELTTETDNKTYKRIDDGEAPPAGVWKITGRLQNGKIEEIHSTGTRKTLKVLTGSRFQWFAIDPASNFFSGTGGGTYTFENGKYTENIEFFSRDASRVGASLSFDDHLEDGKWHHTGLSSRGDKIYEVWGKVQ